MKVLVINGSPKKVSDTMRMTNAFIEGFKSENLSAEIEVVDLISKNIKPCLGCFGCWARGDGKCVQTDDQNEILEKFVDSDVVIFSFPLYCYGMPGHLKCFVDRTLPLTKQTMVKDEDGSTHHTTIMDFSKLKTLVISGCGFPNWKKNYEALSIMCDYCFNYPQKIFVPETPMMNVSEAAPVVEPKLEQFKFAGKVFAQTGAVPPELMASLESPMIPEEQYIQIVNGGQ